MGHKVNPVGMRVGINREWNAKWFANKDNYAKFLNEDVLIRKFLEKRFVKIAISHIDIARVKTDKGVKLIVTLFAAAVGEIIGQDGANKKELIEKLKTVVAYEELDVRAVKVENADLDATLVAKWIASELENRAAFRGTMKKALMKMRKAGALGCKTLCSGRLGGAEIARAEGYKEGVVPLHTLRADIDFAHVDAHTPYGRIGVKVWICRSLNKVGTEYVNEPAKNQGPRPDRGEKRAPKGDK